MKGDLAVASYTAFDQVQQAIKASKPNAKIVYAELFDPDVSIKDIWSGLFAKGPDLGAVVERGKRLGVDLVLMYRSSKEPNRYTVYLIDVAQQRVMERSGSWSMTEPARKWIPSLSGATLSLLQESAIVTRAQWPTAVPPGNRLTADDLAQRFGRPAKIAVVTKSGYAEWEFEASGRLVIKESEGERQAKWRLVADRLCVTNPTAEQSTEECHARYHIGENLFRTAAESGETMAVFQFLGG